MLLNNTGQALFLLSEAKCHGKTCIYLVKLSNHTERPSSHLLLGQIYTAFCLLSNIQTLFSIVLINIEQSYARLDVNG